MEELVPAGTIVMSGGEQQRKHRSDVLRSSAEFHSKGGRLVRLEFPRTEVQHFGDEAIVWSILCGPKGQIAMRKKQNRKC